MTAAGAALAAAGAVLVVDLAIIGAIALLQSSTIAPAERLLVPVASALGIAAGALVGSGAWPWMGHVLRPPALPTGESPLA